MKPIQVTNMTGLFRKEMLIYALFDAKLKQPIKVVQVGYFFLLAILFSTPFLFAVGLNTITIAISLGVPYFGSSFMSKPIWGGKSFFDYMKTQIKFVRSPRYFFDSNPSKKLGNYTVEQNIQVSRKNDFIKLYNLEKEERSSLWNS